MEDAVSPWFEAAKAHQVQRLARLSKGQGPSNDLRGGHRSRLDSDTPGSVPRALGVRPRRLLERERPLNQVAGEDVGRRRVEEGDHAAQAQGEELVNGRAHAVVGSAHALAAAHAAEEVVLLVVLAEALAARDDGHRRLGSVELPVLRRPLLARKREHARLDRRPFVERRHRVAAVVGLVRLQDLVLIRIDCGGASKRLEMRYDRQI